MTQSTWAQVPGRSVRGPRSPVLVGTALILWTSTLGPALRAAQLPTSATWQVILAGVELTAALVLTRRWAWPVRLVIGAIVGAFVRPSQGELIAVWLVGGGLLGAWVGLGAAPLPRMPVAPRDAMVPVAALAAVSAWQGSDPAATWQPLLPLAVAWVIPLLGERVTGAIGRAGARLGSIVGGAVAACLFTLLGLVAVVLPWLVERPFGIDPLGRRQGWIDRDALPVGPSRAWSEDPASQPRPWSERLRGVALVVLVVGLIAGAAVWRSTDDGSTATPGMLELRDPADLDGGAWSAELRADQTWALDERVALRPFEAYRVWDVQTKYLNVHDGYRVSWKAPACDCKRLHVWLYGGAAAFGLSQRDDHTIASELAKVAYEDGLVVDVENRGLPGQLHWRNATRFSWDLTMDPRPDAALFYDGADEVDSALILSERGLGDTRDPYEPMGEGRYEELFDIPLELDPPSGVDDVGWPTVSDLPNDDPGRLAVARYDRTRQMSRDAGTIDKVPILWFWQPTSHGHAAEPTGPAGSDAADPERARAFARASALLDPEVADLSHVFDDEDRPVFLDETTLSERGARTVAAAIYRKLEPQLRAVDGDHAP